MAISNITQVLIRNIDLLAGEHPLLINVAADELLADWFEHYPSAQLTCFNNNFASHQAIAQKQHSQVTSLFDCYYRGSKQHDLVVIAFPKSKAEFIFTLAMIAPFVNDDSTIVLVGDNKSGIKSVAKQSDGYLDFCIKQDSARHCLLFSARYIKAGTPFNLDSWFTYYDVALTEQTVKVAALPGVFSQKGLDKGTQVLLNNLPKGISGKLLDFGCGAGVISAALALQFPELALTLVDVSALAITSSEQTLKMNGLQGQCIASDGLSEISGTFNWIVSNPPFHQGLKTHYAATELFLTQCTHHLQKNATLLVVANSFLQYQSIMEQSVGHTHKATVNNGFTVYMSKKT